MLIRRLVLLPRGLSHCHRGPSRRLSTENVRKVPASGQGQGRSGKGPQGTQGPPPSTSVDEEVSEGPLPFPPPPHLLPLPPPAREDVSGEEAGGGRSRLGSWAWLGGLSPGYALNASHLTVIPSPAHFYQVLLERSRGARRRLTLASLYLGNGRLERDLVRQPSHAPRRSHRSQRHRLKSQSSDLSPSRIYILR
jgi:hypothetical protein